MDTSKRRRKVIRGGKKKKDDTHTEYFLYLMCAGWILFLKLLV